MSQPAPHISAQALERASREAPFDAAALGVAVPTAATASTVLWLGAGIFALGLLSGFALAVTLLLAVPS